MPGLDPLALYLAEERERERERWRSARARFIGVSRREMENVDRAETQLGRHRCLRLS